MYLVTTLIGIDDDGFSDFAMRQAFLKNPIQLNLIIFCDKNPFAFKPTLLKLPNIKRPIRKNIQTFLMMRQRNERTWLPLYNKTFIVRKIII
jgi:predicted acetyltransferase